MKFEFTEDEVKGMSHYVKSSLKFERLRSEIQLLDDRVSEVEEREPTVESLEEEITQLKRQATRNSERIIDLKKRVNALTRI